MILYALASFEFPRKRLSGNPANKEGPGSRKAPALYPKGRGRYQILQARPLDLMLGSGSDVSGSMVITPLP